MPADALPVNRPVARALPGAVTVRRPYSDPLGRALTGQVTLTAAARTTADDGTAVLPVPVSVDLVGGVLEVSLPPGSYRLSGTLRTVQGADVVESGTLTVA